MGHFNSQTVPRHCLFLWCQTQPFLDSNPILCLYPFSKKAKTSSLAILHMSFPLYRMEYSPTYISSSRFLGVNTHAVCTGKLSEAVLFDAFFQHRRQHGNVIYGIHLSTLVSLLYPRFYDAEDYIDLSLS